MSRRSATEFVVLALVALSAGCAGSNAESEATGTIAFVRGSDAEGQRVWLMRADGSEQRAITGGSSPAWSPDGRRFAFVSGVPGKYSEYVFVVGVNGSGRRQVSPTREEVNYERDKEPVWSPDGRMIAFHGRDYGQSAVYVVGADGRGERRLAPPRARVGGAVSPTWAPDGRTIVYTDGLVGVFVVRPDGSRRRLLVGMRRVSYICCYKTPTWSPDGRWIAFTRNYDQLWVVGVDGTRPRRVANGRASDIAWSPDGTTIAFVQPGGRDYDIFVVAPDGTGLRNLTETGRGDDVGPTWSPDGRAIAFVAHRDGNDEIYVMHADGSDQRNVSDNPDADSDPAWSPKG